MEKWRNGKLKVIKRKKTKARHENAKKLENEVTIQSKCLDLKTFWRFRDNKHAATMDKFHAKGFLAEN